MVMTVPVLPLLLLVSLVVEALVEATVVGLCIGLVLVGIVLVCLDPTDH